MATRTGVHLQLGGYLLEFCLNHLHVIRIDSIPVHKIMKSMPLETSIKMHNSNLPTERFSKSANELGSTLKWYDTDCSNKSWTSFLWNVFSFELHEECDFHFKDLSYEKQLQVPRNTLKATSHAGEVTWCRIRLI